MRQVFKAQTLVLLLGLGTLFYGAASQAQQAKHEPSQAEKLFARAKADDFMGDEFCSSCHGEKVTAFAGSAHSAVMHDASLSIEKQGCEGCHGPGAIHQADENAEVLAFRKMDPKESSAACLRCHEATLSPTHWKRSEHAKADLACVSCHQIHPDSDPALPMKGLRKVSETKAPVFTARRESKNLLRADEATLCGSCHGAQAAQFRLSTHHPVPEGRMLCSDCHTVHATKGDKVKVKDDRDKCVTCHTEFRGPFVFEHDPVAGHSGDGCMECHKPHGSNNPKMLNSFSRGLCAQCHTDRLQNHYPGRTCWTAGCHTAPHGSNTSPELLKR
ncbi:MAG: hypothetical protein KIT11_00925 [Fimbriimonadaceae bacterium]|nr:hypothetical protein [Fimbriimonadaceae bacterium]QYK55064.1 MAG: hypothetical protein KF733_08610 [Fimbriimonadaceae bacterium]